MPRRHLDVGVVGADALGPLEQLLCRGRRVLSQQRVRSVSQHLRRIIVSTLLVIVSNVSSMDTFEFLCSIFFVQLFIDLFPSHHGCCGGVSSFKASVANTFYKKLHVSNFLCFMYCITLFGGELQTI